MTKSGILDTDGRVIHFATGTPQGGIVSPILAKGYLHYALDGWFEEAVKAYCKGKAHLCRYADDCVCAFEVESDAQRFYLVLPKRLAKDWKWRLKRPTSYDSIKPQRLARKDNEW
ncbi:MAG: reverse transcriptase domain-containing protein [Methylococcales bacterium]